MNPALLKEWLKHRSKFSAVWYGQMLRRRLVVSVTNDNAKVEELTVAVDAFMNDGHISARQRTEMIKDFHLAICAWAGGQAISSCDDKMRDLMARLAKKNFSDLGGIAWVNPLKSIEDPIGWLKSGAKAENERKLKNWTLSDE